MNPPPAAHKPFPVIPILVLLGCAVAASTVFWQATTTTRDVFVLPKELRNVPFGNASPAQKAAYEKAEQERRIRQTALEGAILGAAGCGLLGLGLGLLSHSVLRTLGCLGLGVLLGGGLGAAGGSLDQMLFFGLTNLNTVAAVDPMTLKLMLGHGALWVLLALGLAPLAGLASGSARGVLKGLLAGLGAAVIAALLFPILGALVFPQSNAEDSIPGNPGELIRFGWAFLWTGLSALAAGRLIDFRPAPPAVANPVD